LLLRENGAIGKLCQHEYLTPVEGQFADALVVHQLAEDRVVGIDGGHLGGHRHALGLGAQFERDVDGDTVAHIQGDSTVQGFLEPRRFAGERVAAGGNLRQNVPSLGAGPGGDGDVGGDVGGQDRGVCDSGARSIGHEAGD
jgi:hypothetical protein